MKLNTLPPTKRTHQGAPAKTIPPHLALQRTVLSCLLWEDTFYESGIDISERIEKLASEVDEMFLAGLAINARNHHNLRHAPLLLVNALSKKGSKQTRAVVRAIVKRPDEITELLAILWRNGKINLPRQLKLGLADAFYSFDEYQFSKWEKKKSAIKIRDVIRLVHPKPQTEEQSKLFEKIAHDQLSPPDTWESRLTAGEDKKDVFTDLLKRKKLGYMALLKNLRGMVEAGVNENLIRTAILNPSPKVLPFRFITAARAVPRFEPVLEKAMMESMTKFEKLPGRTILLVDVSGSMQVPISGKSQLTRLDSCCALAMLCSAICEDIRVFSFSNKLIEVPPRQGFALSDAIAASQDFNGTYLGSAITAVNSLVADRLIVFTDEQSTDRVPLPALRRAYMVNVAPYKRGVGYGQWIHIDGFSEQIIHYIAQLESSFQG